MTNAPEVTDFASLGLPEHLLKAISEVGYEKPSPIQAQSIPILLDGCDLLGQAQTGTGKTAAFALPLLSRIDPKARYTQLLILAPTRELAIQVAEACQSYAHHIPQFRVLPIYGGASYSTQLKQLKSNPQVVVGTPGRVMDHLRRGTLKLDQLRALVLDEADEMLRMGFIDDVEWILEHTPDDRQTALFSATMPKEIQRVAQNYLNEPQTVKIAGKTQTATAITQRYWPIGGINKLDALTRILEVEPIDGVIIFVRTKISTTELADRLCARGFSADALNGDMAQAQREKTIEKMRAGKLDILIATDVAARGIDIQRVSHVINYDIPFDTEAYVHRIGRTGRAGRKGEAILFVANRERRMLKAIERATKQPIELMRLPSEQDINTQRVERFMQRIDEARQADDLDFYKQMLTDYISSREIDAIDALAGLARMVQGDQPFLVKDKPAKKESRSQREWDDDRPAQKGKRRKKDETLADTNAKPLKDFPDVDMQRFRIDVGYSDGVAPGHIVGAIANEADIESKYIGHIEIFDDYSVVDLPAEMPPEVLSHLQGVWVCQQKLNMRAFTGADDGQSRRSSRKRNDKPDGNRKDRRGKDARDGRGKSHGNEKFAKKGPRRKSDDGERRGGPKKFRGGDKKPRTRK
ncbi:DEAD/DEAH box helicase [Aurantivibrio plasticivorans]